MTGEDHDTDALIATLTSPALPSERVGEEAAVTAMLGAMSAVPAAPTGHRPRRGIAIAAVTVASLGVGGLVAAGPGNFFSPAANRPPSTTTGPNATSGGATDDATDGSSSTEGHPSATTLPGSDVGATPSIVGSIVAPGIDLTDEQSEAAADCEADRHGDAVSDVARSSVPGQVVSDVAQSDCGKPEPAGGKDDNPSITAPGQTGDSPSSTAPGRTGESPSDTAPGQTGESPADTAPGQSVEPPADTAPGQTGANPSDTAPGQTGANPSDTAPGQTDESPADTAPGQTDGNPSDTAPGQAGGTGRP